MSWFEDAKAIIEKEEKFDKEKGHHLIIKKEDDVNIDLTAITSISFSYDYQGVSQLSLLYDVISKCNDLKDIKISNCNVQWDDLCSLDFSKIESLSFSLKGTLSGKTINAPNLKKLDIFNGPEQTPLEKQLGIIPPINFSGMPLLEDLRLSHFQAVEVTNFQSLKHLKKLTIISSNIHTLDWLKEASYQLESLAIDSPIESCFGVEFHPNLKWLALWHTKITDVTPIEKLEQLTHLDMRYLDSLDCTSLSNKVKEVLVTHKDDALFSIRTNAKKLLFEAVVRLRRENRLFLKIDELPDLRRKALIRSMNEPLDIRLQRHILSAYLMEIAKMTKPTYPTCYKLSKEEYKEIFCAEVYKYYPFLADYQSQR